MPKAQVVVDLGCKTYGDDESISRLILRYEPESFYGFDPLLNGSDTSHPNVELRAEAAWTFDGEIALGVGAPQLLDATVMQQKRDRGEWENYFPVPCFDLAMWLASLGKQVVLKMNIEGAEFPLLEHLLDTGAIMFVDELVIAWHDERLGENWTVRRREIEQRLEMPVVEWSLW